MLLVNFFYKRPSTPSNKSMMTPELTDRQKRYVHIAKSLESASKEYENAALGLAQARSEEEVYRHIKKANAAVESAFPELFAPSKPITPPQAARDYTIIKIIVIAVLVLGLLYAFVVFGPTGDLSKTWITEDFQKNIAYPK
jgi:hypothetical protein